MAREKTSTMIKLGPAGYASFRGSDWDEKGRTKIVQIFVSYDDETIRMIQFQYADETGALRMSNQHGSPVGASFHAVKLDYPSEYITCVRGNYSFDLEAITLITFDTNVGTHGPFGTRSADCKDFCFNVGCQFGGFYGHLSKGSSPFLNCIGVYLNPITTLDSVKKVKDERIPVFKLRFSD